MAAKSARGASLATGPALVAAATGLFAAEVARVLFGFDTAAAVFGDRFTALIPLPVFSWLLSLLDGNAKHLFYIAMLIGQGLLTACVGATYWEIRRRLARRRHSESADAENAHVDSPGPPLGFLDVVALVVLLWLLSTCVVSPLIGGGFFGVALSGGARAAITSQVIADVVFAIVFSLRLNDVLKAQAASAETPGDTAGHQLTRRRVLRRGLALAGILGAGALVVRALAPAIESLLGTGGSGSRPPLDVSSAPARITPPPVPVYSSWTDVAGETPEVTSTPNFYYVSKNLVNDPSINANGWHLTIGGLVDRPYTLSYAQLQALPQIERYHTLECISNDVGGNLMSNARFVGTSLASVLQAAGIRVDASEMVFTAADGYSDSLHLSQALDARSLIVYQINGGPLPQAHGFPARLLIPGLYGMKNGKWLTRLDLGAGGYEGYWEQRGWTREALVKMTSRIDTPHNADLLLERPTYIAGVAFAADRGISRVDVTLDAGKTWSPARLKRPLGDLTWVLWEYPWRPTRGQYVIASRAIDLDGRVQAPQQAPPLPDGASGYDAITVTVG